MILTEYEIAIDPVDYDSEVVFERAGYKIVNSKDFDITLLK